MLEARVEQLQEILRQQTSATSISRTAGIPDPRQALLKQILVLKAILFLASMLNGADIA